MIFEQVQQIIADKLGLELSEITMESSLNDDLNADSLDVLDIITDVEEEYDIEIPQEDLEQMEKVSDLVAYIEGTI